jgi:hypothetical protein
MRKVGLDWSEDKKLFVAVWNSLKKPKVAKMLFSFVSVFLFAGATDEAIGIFENFKDGGLVVFILLMIPPYLIATWAVPVDFKSHKTRQAMFVSIACVLFTGFVLRGEQSNFLTQAFISNIGILLFWVWVFLFKTGSNSKAGNV